MKNKTLAVTIGSVILGAGMAMGTVAYANHGHTGNNATTGMGMMGSAPQTVRPATNGHMGTGSGGNMNAPVTSGTTQNDMHGNSATDKTQNHMTSSANDTTSQHHATNDHHKDFNGHHGQSPAR